MDLSPRLLAAAAIAICVQAEAFAGHDNIPVDPALKRYSGQVTALGEADAEGRIYSFRARRLPAAPDYAPDELRGWRLTMLAGKRFANEFEVQGNTGVEITVGRLDGPLNGIAVKDVFVIENIAIERPAGRSRSWTAGSWCSSSAHFHWSTSDPAFNARTLGEHLPPAAR